MEIGGGLFLKRTGPHQTCASHGEEARAGPSRHRWSLLEQSHGSVLCSWGSSEAANSKHELLLLEPCVKPEMCFLLWTLDVTEAAVT